MSFHVGQKVVCVDDDYSAPNWRHLPNRPAKGDVCTIREVLSVDYGQTLGKHAAFTFNEYVNPVRDFQEIGRREGVFYHHKFRPLIERSTETGMSILRKVAADAAKRRNLVVAR